MPGTKERILIIDDEPSITRFLSKVLSQENYDVVALNDPRKLEDQLLYAHYDLIITDLRMPGRSGLDVLHAVRISKPHVPVIILTGHGSIETAVEATRLGAAEYITKPVETSGFVQTVNKHARANRQLPKKYSPRVRLRNVPIYDISDDKIALENEIVSTDTVPEGFVEVRFDSIVPGEKLPFSIYIQLLNKSTGKLFLRRICLKGTIYTSGLRNMLFKRNLSSVFIEEKDYRDYIKFLTHLKSLPNFRGVQKLDDKKLVLYGKAVEAVTDILTRPVNQASVQAAVNFVDDLFRNMVKTPELYEGMYRLFKQESSIFNHAANVSLLTVSFALHLELMDATVKMLGLGALYHDVGMVSVDKEILEKPGPLNEEEWNIIEQHPVKGAEVMEKGVLFPGPAIRIIREHHEQIDGSGYPNGLRGKQIGSMTHLVRIVDKFEGMTTDKPYRTALRPSDALRQIFKEEKSANVRKLLQRFVRFLGG